MSNYASKADLIAAIKTAADKFIAEFIEIDEADKDLRLVAVDRTPAEMIAYQLGWLQLIQSWDQAELQGQPLIMPAPGIKWNQLGTLYTSFYEQHHTKTLAILRAEFVASVAQITHWLQTFSEAELFEPGGRNWAASTPANWPVQKWVHINTVAPFTSFRTKIRKWKRLKANLQQE